MVSSSAIPTAPRYIHTNASKLVNMLSYCSSVMCISCRLSPICGRYFTSRMYRATPAPSISSAAAMSNGTRNMQILDLVSHCFTVIILHPNASITDV